MPRERPSLEVQIVNATAVLQTSKSSGHHRGWSNWRLLECATSDFKVDCNAYPSSQYVESSFAHPAILHWLWHVAGHCWQACIFVVLTYGVASLIPAGVPHH